MNATREPDNGEPDNGMKIVEKSGLFHVIGPDCRDYGRRATREQADGLLAWVMAEATELTGEGEISM